ncbi:MAG: PilZ domain-containing protein [Desulfomonilaceae bacterium]
MPTKKVIKARDLIRDIRDEMTDPELMEKYQLSIQSLQEIRKRLPESGRLEIKAIVADIRARSTDFELCHKYDLSLEELPGVFEKLVELGVIRTAELKERSAFYDEPLNRSVTRRFPRTLVGLELPIYDRDDQTRKGLVRDLSERGLRVASLRPDINLAKRFVIRPDWFPPIRPFDIGVECRWIKKKKPSRNYFMAGFEITSISSRSQAALRKVLLHVRLTGDSFRPKLP